MHKTDNIGRLFANNISTDVRQNHGHGLEYTNKTRTRSITQMLTAACSGGEHWWTRSGPTQRLDPITHTNTHTVLQLPSKLKIYAHSNTRQFSSSVSTNEISHYTAYRDHFFPLILWINRVIRREFTALTEIQINFGLPVYINSHGAYKKVFIYSANLHVMQKSWQLSFLCRINCTPLWNKIHRSGWLNGT